MFVLILMHYFIIRDFKGFWKEWIDAEPRV